MLTEQQRTELQAYASANGKAWKGLLRSHWLKGEPVPGYPSLYGLRNSHGPAWLNKVKM